MPFWSKKKVLFRLFIAAILAFVLHFLNSYTVFDEPQVASLPDGIGGFPSCESRCSSSDHVQGEAIVESTVQLEGPNTGLTAPGVSGDKIWSLGEVSNVDGTDKDVTKQDEEEEEEQAILGSSYESSKIAEALEDIRKSQEKTSNYVQAIFDPSDETVDRLTCPRMDHGRYKYLKVPKGERQRAYYFALDLRQVVDLLPRLFGSIVEAMHFLGPQNCALTVIEGNSDDGTWEVLAALRPELENMGVRYFLQHEKLDPTGSDDRIGNLARLRSLALEPLRNSRNATAYSLGLHGSTLDYTDDAVVVFLNDVAACGEDIRRYPDEFPGVYLHETSGVLF